MTVHFPENLRDMRLFIAVYEERSFTAAAERENATQSGVSQHIRKLEELLGSQLLIRRSGSVVPTPAGDAFYAGCISIFRVLDEVHGKLTAFEGGLEGEVRLGVTPTTARCILAPALSRFVEKHPNVVVHVEESYSATVTDRLRAGELDVAVVPGMPDELGITGKLITRTAEHLVMSAQTAWRLQIQDAAGRLPRVKLVLPSKAQARRALLDRYVATTEFGVERCLEMDSMFGTLDFVAGTDWVSILPALMLARADARLVTIPLRNPPLLLELFRIENASRPLSPAAATMIGFLEDQAIAQQKLLDAQDAARAPGL